MRFELVRRHVSSPDLFLLVLVQTHDLNQAQQRSPVLRNSFQHPAPDPAEFVNATAAPLEQKQAHDFGQSWAAASFVPQDGTSHPPHAQGSLLPFADFHEWSKRSSFSLLPAKIGTNAAPSNGPQEKRRCALGSANRCAQNALGSGDAL